jgi:hypothetical protein
VRHSWPNSAGVTPEILTEGSFFARECPDFGQHLRAPASCPGPAARPCRLRRRPRLSAAIVWATTARSGRSLVQAPRAAIFSSSPWRALCTLRPRHRR